MELYKIDNGKVKFLKPKELMGPKGEKELQTLIEQNLGELFDGLVFIGSEIELQRKELDTLAYSKENEGIVIIEYKKGSNSGIVDQGMAYLSLVHENKEFLELKIEKKLGNTLKIDWKSTRIIFIANRFDDFQIKASAIKGVPFELWAYDLYDGLLALRRIEEPTTRTSFNTLIQDKKGEYEKMSQEIETYDLEYHLKKTKIELRPVFERYRQGIMAFGPEVSEVIDQKTGITYKNNKISFIRFEFRSDHFNAIFKEKAGFVDPKHLSVDIRSNKWGFERLVEVSSMHNFDDVNYLLKQAYETTL